MKLNKNMKNFILLFAGQTVSQMGSAMTGFAVIIWAYTQAGEVMASSVLAFCSAVPYLIVSLLGGAVADRFSKKRIMLVCDAAAALGSLAILVCLHVNCLQLWILCAVNMLNGFMNAFQGPASQVAVSLLVDQKDYVRIGGIQSAAGALTGMLNPVLGAALLGIGGLKAVLMVDLATFLFAFSTLLIFVKIPETFEYGEAVTFHDIKCSMKESVSFLKVENEILLLLVMYGVLEFMGAISFDSMYSPLLLARTNNNEMIVGIVSSVAAAGSMAASLMLTVIGQPEKKISPMFAGSILCLLGIMFFGMGRSLGWWCIVVFCGCFGAPVYQTYQTAILRERVPIHMQGRMFAMQGMITQILAPVGYLIGAVLADYVFEPFMQREGMMQALCAGIVGEGSGSGMGILFVLAGFLGIVIILALHNNEKIRNLDSKDGLRE